MFKMFYFWFNNPIENLIFFLILAAIFTVISKLIITAITKIVQVIKNKKRL